MGGLAHMYAFKEIKTEQQVTHQQQVLELEVAVCNFLLVTILDAHDQLSADFLCIILGVARLFDDTINQILSATHALQDQIREIWFIKHAK